MGRQPPNGEWHPSTMNLRALLTAVFACMLGISLACTNQNPDQIRQKTAEETAAIKRDTKAVAQGVKEGLSSKRSVDLNKATKDDLSSLPGIDARRADHIIAERPYANPHQLVTRHVLSEDEYSQIQDRVIVNR
jgi:DNA uptake protein ComE-like DNA-binding protein